ncbi:glycosyltransferase [Metabacillus niabensis]|uniref:glycosyltransferase n=1 Tax=Metabacillus niabensis TaxID=324854 RepID=UPI001CFB3B7B|nr:glycosyltransferase [Metabacillus niabensis]
MNVTMLLFKDVLYDARVQREALSLAEEGHLVEILCLKEYEENLPKLHDHLSIKRFSISTKAVKQKLAGQSKSATNRSHSVKSILFKVVQQPVVKLIKDLWAYDQFYKQCDQYLTEKKDQVDVIHCHDLNTLSAGVKLSRKYNMYLIYDSHELFNEMAGRNEVDRKYGYWLEKKLMKEIDHLIVVNPYVEQEFKKMYGDHIKATIIQNTPINTLQTKRSMVVKNLREFYRIENNEIFLIYQGGLSPFRGIELIINSLTYLPDKFKLVIMGTGRLLTNLIALVEELKLTDRVFFHPQVKASEVLHYTKQADIGLVMYENTSKNNYFSTPNKIFEYLLAGIPTVASKHPGKQYVVEVEKTGICTEENPVSIAKAIQDVIENYDTYVSNCKAKQYVYTWEYEKQKLQALYNEIKQNVKQ